MYSLELDIPITRRQRLNALRDGDGHLRFTSSRPSDAFDWLWSHGKKEVRIEVCDRHGVRNVYYMTFMKAVTDMEKRE